MLFHASVQKFYLINVGRRFINRVSFRNLLTEGTTKMDEGDCMKIVRPKSYCGRGQGLALRIFVKLLDGFWYIFRLKFTVTYFLKC